MLSINYGRKRIEGLSDKEIETLKLRVQGYEIAEIAAKIHRSTHTVISHSKRILVKLGANHMPQAVHEAHKRGYLP